MYSIQIFNIIYRINVRAEVVIIKHHFLNTTYLKCYHLKNYILYKKKKNYLHKCTYLPKTRNKW